MATARVRPMTGVDIAPAADLLRQGAWGERESFFAYAVEQPHVMPFVAERDDLIVATGVASAHGRVGWVGTIFVAEQERGRGIGGAITAAVIESLERAGCATLVLVATDLGRPVYERLGFETRTFYQTFDLEGRSPGGPSGNGDVRLEESGREDSGREDSAGPGGIRPFGPTDVAEAAALDAAATGEDRLAVLAAMAAVDGGLALRVDDGSMTGFVLRAPWGGGATVARSADAAMRLLDERRLRAGPGHVVRAGLPLENDAGRAALEAAGWRATWRARRMERGPRLEWRPGWLWGQFGMAIG